MPNSEITPPHTSAFHSRTNTRPAHPSGAYCAKYVPRTVLFDLEPGAIGAVCASPLGELFRPDEPVNQNAGAGDNWAKAH